MYKSSIFQFYFLNQMLVKCFNLKFELRVKRWKFDSSLKKNGFIASVIQIQYSLHSMCNSILIVGEERRFWGIWWLRFCPRYYKITGVKILLGLIESWPLNKACAMCQKLDGIFIGRELTPTKHTPKFYSPTHFLSHQPF